MKIAAGEREMLPLTGLYGTPEGEEPEPIDRWIARKLDEAQGTEPRQLKDLTLTVGTEVYRELLQTVADYPHPSELVQTYGAELVIDHELAEPFIITWTSREEAAIERLKQQYGDDIAIVDRDGRRFY